MSLCDCIETGRRAARTAQIKARRQTVSFTGSDYPSNYPRNEPHRNTLHTPFRTNRHTSQQLHKRLQQRSATQLTQTLQTQPQCHPAARTAPVTPQSTNPNTPSFTAPADQASSPAGRDKHTLGGCTRFRLAPGPECPPRLRAPHPSELAAPAPGEPEMDSSKCSWARKP